VAQPLPVFIGEKRVADKKLKCIGGCGKEFGYGDWECFPGQPHRVEAKNYYRRNAPHCDFERDPDGTTLRKSQDRVYVLPPKRIKDESGERIIERAPLLFVGGRYETDDPETQYHLERKPELTCSYESWFEAFHTPKQKLNIAQGKVAEEKRQLESQLQESNALLAKLKADAAEKQKEVEKAKKEAKA
jgi:hypothetical protein